MSVGSHQTATFGLAKELSKKGHKVTYAGAELGIYEEDLSANAISQGFHYEKLDLFGYTEVFKDSNQLSHAKFLLINLAKNLFEGEILSKFIARTQPDMILLDIHLPIYAIAFYPSGIPLVFLSTELSTDQNSFNPPISSSMIPTSTCDHQLTVEIDNAWAQYLKINKLHPAVKYLVEELSKENDFPIDKYYTEKCIVLFGLKLPELILWPCEFEFNEGISLLPKRYYVGDCVDIDRNEPDMDWSAIDSHQPIIYCSLGTIVDDPFLISFLKRLIIVFGTMSDYQFILSAGKVYDQLNDVVSGYHENIHTFKSVPQMRVLNKACLMITLAGGNSIKEAILMGVPLLCYPFTSDQFGNAARIVYHRLGLRGDIGKDSLESIRNKIKEVIHNGDFTARVNDFIEIFKAYKRNSVALSTLESLAKIQ
ncbi:MAG: glycosyltransferase [Bacteroidota bacterium]